MGNYSGGFELRYTCVMYVYFDDPCLQFISHVVSNRLSIADCYVSLKNPISLCIPATVALQGGMLVSRGLGCFEVVI